MAESSPLFKLIGRLYRHIPPPPTFILVPSAENNSTSDTSESTRTADAQEEGTSVFTP